MAAFKCYAPLDRYDSKKLNSFLQLSDRRLIFAFNSHAQLIGSCVSNNPFRDLKLIRVSRLDTEVSDVSELSNVGGPVDLSDENVVMQQPKLYGEFKKGRRSIWKRRDSMKNVVNDSKGKRSSNGLELSLEDCNFILGKLEKGRNDDETLRYFDLMRINGKLKHNVKAYKLALRVLGRRQDWEGAERMIEEMQTDSCCELSFQVFNTLIFACHKRGLASIGTKWFRMMLDRGVQPNVASFGMVMSLYQKFGLVDEAEFAFSVMRNSNIVCESAYSAMITICTRLELHDKAEEVIGLLKEDGVTLDKENWLVLLNAYSKQGKLGEAEKVLVSMYAAGFPPHIVAYNTLLTGYGKVSNMDAAQRIFQNIISAGLEPDETTYRTMIEGWGRVQNLKEAEWYYKELKSSGFKPNSSNLYTLINLQAINGDEAGAIRTINDMMEMGCQFSSILTIVLQTYEKAGRFDKVPSVVKGLFYNHILNNQTSCSILVMDYVKHSLVDDAIEVLGNKRWKDKIFEDNLYHTLICTCKELGLLENSIKIYASMPKSDKPNVHIASTMIDIYSCLSQFEEAKNIYLKLKSAGVALDLIAFSIVVRMYVKSGSLNEACSVLDTMEKQKNIVPDIYLYRDMLRIYQRLGMVNKVGDLYYRILKADVTWDQELYNCLINCCAPALSVDELSRLFNEMIQHGFSPSTTAFNVMLHAYGKHKLFEKAKKVFSMAQKQGMVNVISYNTLVAAYGKSKDFKHMRATVREMQLNGFSVSLEAYNCLLDVYGKKGEMEKFRNVLLRMKKTGCASDNYTYNIMINIYGEKRWIKEVSDVLKELKESGLKPDICSYNSLIKAYGIAGMPEDAVALVKEMRANGIEPDRRTYTNVIRALQRNDMVLEAIKWSLWMKQMGV